MPNRYDKLAELNNIVVQSDMPDEDLDATLETFKVLAMMDPKDMLPLVRTVLEGREGPSDDEPDLREGLELLSRNFDTLMTGMVNLEKRIRALELARVESLKAHARLEPPGVDPVINKNPWRK